MDQIGKYEILDKIGTGGFAVVYKGYDPYIKRKVAIKLCFSRDPETRERFYREAEIAGLLMHRNITTVYDFGLHEETPFLVEEYLPGEDLAHMIRRREPETLAEKLDVLTQIVGGLGYAHSKNVIHRDIKPSNVRILDNRRVKIMDFGTAKLTTVESNLTQTGMTLGTVAYLSPERLLGKPSGTNSDLFSFGVLAYELLSFRRPFTGRNIPSLIDQVLNSAPVPLQESWPECPPALAEIVHKCLVKDPAARYDSCEPLLADLEQVQAEYCSRSQPLAVESSATIPQVSVQLSGLLERAKELYDRGKYQRAELLLDEVLEIAPENVEAKQLLVACRAALERTALHDGQTIPTGARSAVLPSRAVSVAALAASAVARQPSPEVGPAIPTQTSVWEAPQDRRTRKVQEAVSSINGYVEAGQLMQAAEALKFAVHFLGAFAETQQLRQRIVEALRERLTTVRGEGFRQARKIVERMNGLRQKNRLPVELAETFVDWVGELDPDDLAARHILASVQQDARLREAASKPTVNERKKQEAVASIEKLLAEGNPAMAEKALDFAVRLFGEFEQIPQLQHRISQALRQQG